MGHKFIKRVCSVVTSIAIASSVFTAAFSFTSTAADSSDLKNVIIDNNGNEELSNEKITYNYNIKDDPSVVDSSSVADDVIYEDGRILAQKAKGTNKYRSFLVAKASELSALTEDITYERYVNGKLAYTEQIGTVYKFYYIGSKKCYAPNGSYYAFALPTTVNTTDRVVDIYTLKTADKTIKYGRVLFEGTNSSSTVAGSSAQSSSASINHTPLSIALSTTHNSTYATITPTFTDGLNCDVDYTSLKWAYGIQNSDYFADNGYTFTNSFAVLQNGTYTVFAKDTSGNEAVGTVTINGIYTKPTQGAFVQTFTDLSVDSIGLPCAFERTYNSMDNSDGVFGNGWSLNYAKSTCLSDDGTVRLVYLPDGTINYFSISDNTYTGIRTQNKLIADGNKLILTTKDNIKYTYENNYLTRIEDSNGNFTAIELNSENLPVKIIDSASRVYSITYNNNKITSITDPAGRVFTYAYDESGNLTEQKSANGAIVNKFIYANGLLTKITDSSDNTLYEVTYNDQHQALTVTDADGNTTYYLYKITDNGETVIYESDSEIILDETDCTTYPENNTYDPFDQVVLDSEGLLYEYNSDGTIHKNDGEKSDKTVYTYDENGNVTHIKTTDKNDKLVEDVTYTYLYLKGTSNISSSTEVIVTYSYDDEGVLSETDTEKNTTSYDSNGNILSERSVYNDEDKTVSYSYNNRGLMLSETADGKFTEYTYDINGNITGIKTVEDNVETNASFSYNIIGQVLTQIEESLTTSNVYDLFGNAIKVTQTDGEDTHVTRIVYDNNNRVLQKIVDQQYRESDDGLKPDENSICLTNVYNNGNVGERYTYDTNGNVLTYINSANNKTVNTYDSENRLVKTVTYENTDTTANGLVTRYIYDTDGNLIQTIYPHQYNSENDNLNLHEGTNEYTDSTVGERVTYDENGNVIKSIDSFGKETVNTYDSQNHLVKSVTDNEITRFVYNGGDNLLQVIYPDQYNPDNDNLDLSAETPIDTYADSTVGDRYTYDDDGNVLTYTNRFGKVTTNTYDSDGNIKSTTKPDGTVFTFNEEGKGKKETYANGLVRDFTYTSNQTIATGSNGITVTYNLNAFGEIEEYRLQNSENDKRYSYTYDSNGNITTISLNGTLQQTFTYNSSNELVRVDDATANKSISYEYDYVGNITAVKTYIYTTDALGTPLTTQNYTYNSQNQRTDLSYDANGNMAELNGYALTWDDRKLSAAVSENDNISYTYNHNGIRTSKTVNGITTYYEVDENNNVIKQYELVDGIETNVIEFVYDSSNAPIYFTYNNETYYYEKNLQGDIVAILDTNGNTVVEYTYDIWGKLLSTTGTLASTIGEINPLRYRGYYYDNETELYYLQSRYYSPDLMRFISQDDPLLSNDQGQPLGSNLYAYCLNNPVNLIDKSGEVAGIIVPYAALFVASVCASSSLKKAKQNYTHNLKYSIRGIIYSQNKSPLTKMKFGSYTMNNVGCGVVAVYNALYLLKKNPSFAWISYYLDVRGYLNGKFGANIFAMNSLLKSYNIKTKLSLFPDSTDSSIKKSKNKMAIIAYSFKYNKTKIGAHYILVKWNGKSFLAYNNDKSDGAQKINSIDKYMKKGNRHGKYSYLGIIHF